MEALKNDASMRWPSSKLQMRARILEAGLNEAQPRNLPSLVSTRTVSPGSPLPLAMALSKIHGWRRSAERSLPSLSLIVFIRAIVVLYACGRTRSEAVLLLTRPGMRGVIRLRQVLKVQARIDLRGGDVGVAKQLLHTA